MWFYQTLLTLRPQQHLVEDEEGLVDFVNVVGIAEDEVRHDDVHLAGGINTRKLTPPFPR